MRSYCVKQKKETLCIPGTERITTAENGRQMSVCVCAECGITKIKFVKSGQTGSATKTDFACGYDLKGKRAGTVDECFKKGQIRRYGIKKLDDGYIDVLVADRAAERNEKARARRRAKKPEARARRGASKEQLDEELNFIRDFLDAEVKREKARKKTVEIIENPYSEMKPKFKLFSKPKPKIKILSKPKYKTETIIVEAEPAKKKTKKKRCNR